MNCPKSILFVGVGGQGIILASKVLSEGLVEFEYDVKMSEIHGMAQRGGSVTTQVRFGEKVYSPLIGIGEADVIVAFEKVEAARFLHFLKEGGSLVVNDYELDPVPVLMGSEQYPEDVTSKLKDAVPGAVIADAAGIAEKIGNIKVQNMVLLGVLIRVLGLTNHDWGQVLKKYVPEKYYDMNLRALKYGMELM